MAVAKFVPHLPNEHALHRWDVTGDDDTSQGLPGHDDLAGRSHDPDLDSDFTARLRSEGHAVPSMSASGERPPRIPSSRADTRKLMSVTLASAIISAGQAGPEHRGLACDPQ